MLGHNTSLHIENLFKDHKKCICDLVDLVDQNYQYF